MRHSDLKDCSSQCTEQLLPQCQHLDPSHVQRWRSPHLHLSYCLLPFSDMIRDAPPVTEVLLTPLSSGAATRLLSSTSRSRLREHSSQVQRSTCTGVLKTTQDRMGGPLRYRLWLSHRLVKIEHTTSVHDGTPQPCLESPETAEHQLALRTIRMRPSHWKLQQISFSQASCRSLILPVPLCPDKDGWLSVSANPNSARQVDRDRYKQRRTHFHTRTGTDSKMRTTSITIRK